MNRAITVRFTGLTGLVRHKKKATKLSQIMDTIMVQPLDTSMMPRHFPVLIAVKGTIRFSHPNLLKPAKPGTVNVPNGMEAWQLSGLELRFPDAPKHPRPVTHVGDSSPSPTGSVGCHDLDDWTPLSMIPNVTEAGEAEFDDKWLGPIGKSGKKAATPVGARVRLSGGSIGCEPKKIPDPDAASLFWQLKRDGKAFPGRPMAEIIALCYPVLKGQCYVQLDVVLLSSKPSDQPLGAVYLLVCGEDFEFRNFPRPLSPQKARIGHASIPPPVKHFDAFYDLLVKPKGRPIPHYWGRRELTVRANASKPPRLVVASEEGRLPHRPHSHDFRTDIASCPNGAFMA